MSQNYHIITVYNRIILEYRSSILPQNQLVENLMLEIKGHIHCEGTVSIIIPAPTEIRYQKNLCNREKVGKKQQLNGISKSELPISS